MVKLFGNVAYGSFFVGWWYTVRFVLRWLHWYSSLTPSRVWAYYRGSWDCWFSPSLQSLVGDFGRFYANLVCYWSGKGSGSVESQSRVPRGCCEGGIATKGEYCACSSKIVYVNRCLVSKSPLAHLVRVDNHLCDHHNYDQHDSCHNHDRQQHQSKACPIR